MSNRRVVCEAAFGFGPFDTITETDWVELKETTTGIAGKPRLRSADWSIGRDNELEHFQAGTATVVLSNRDRHLDPDNAASPHVGELLPYTPVRLRSKNETAGTFEDEFYGYVQDGWQQQIDTNMSDCRAELVDMLGVLSGYRLPDVFEQAVLDQDPVGFWILDTTASDSEQVEDLGSGKVDGNVIGEGITLGDRVIIPGHRLVARFDVTFDETTLQTTTGAVDFGRSPLMAPASWATPLVVLTFQARTKASSTYRVLFTHGNGSTPKSGIQAHINTAGKLVYVYLNSAAGTAYITPDVVVGKPGLRATTGHIMFGAGAGLGLDTPTLSTGTTSSGITKKNGAGIGGGTGVPHADHMDGWIGSVALFASNTTVGSTGRQAIFDAYSKLDGLRSDEHISWALDRIGIPAGLRNLAAGTVMLGFADTKDRDALEWMREVVATEGGELYIDHRDGGKIRFTNRYHRFLNSRSATDQATFSDQPGVGAVIRYSAEGLEVTPNGLDGIINQVPVAWRDGEILVEDAASIAAYGPRTRQIDTQAITAAQARSAGEWIVSRYKDPRSRIRGCVASARSTRQHDDRVQGLRVDDRVTFKIQPLHTGTVTTTSLYVDGITHSAHGIEWVTSFRFAPGNTFTPWIWGTSAWGTTAYWG